MTEMRKRLAWTFAASTDNELVPMRSCSLFVLVFFVGCAGGFASIDLATLPSSRDYPDSDAVRLLDDVLLDYKTSTAGDPYIEATSHERIRVLKPGKDHFGRIRVYYSRTFDQITSFSARTVSPRGEVKTYALDDTEDLPSHESFVLYADSRVMMLDVPATPGSVIEWIVVMRHKELRMWPHKQTFAATIPVEHVALRVRHPKTWTMLVKEYPSELAPVPPMQQRDDGDVRELVWEAKKVAPMPYDDDAAPSVWELAPAIAVHPKRWEDKGAFVEAVKDEVELSRWLYDVTQQFAPVGDTTPAHILEQAKKVVTDEDSPRDKARKLYNWVRDNVSYCAIEIGVGGYKPHAAEDVLRLKYGDCKDKANLLKRLLAASGVESDLVLIHAHSGFPRQRLTLTGGNYNHAILAVKLDGNYVLTDPTSRTPPFGRLPGMDQGSPCIRLNTSGAPMERTQESPPERNFERVEIDLSFGGPGLTGSLKLERDGVLADNLRGALIDAAEGERGGKVAKALQLQGAKVKKLELASPLAPIAEEPLSLTARLDLETSLSGVVALRPDGVLAIGLPALSDAGERKLPLILRQRRRIEHKIRIALGDKYDVSTLPEPVSLTSTIGRYAISYKRDKTALTIERSFSLNESVVPKERYGEAKRFFDEALKAEARAIVLKQRGGK